MSDYKITLKHKDFMYLLEHCTYHPKDNLWPNVVLDSNVCPNCGTEDAWHYDNKTLTATCASCGHERTDMYLSGSAVPWKDDGGGGTYGWTIPAVIFLDEDDEKSYKKMLKEARKETFIWKIKNQPSLLWSEFRGVVKTIKLKIVNFFTLTEK